MGTSENAGWPPLNGNLKAENDDDILVNFRGTLFSDQSIFSLIYQPIYNKTRANRSAVKKFNSPTICQAGILNWGGGCISCRFQKLALRSLSWGMHCERPSTTNRQITVAACVRVAISILYVSFPSSYNYGTCIYRHEGSVCPLVTYFLTQRSVARDK